MSFRAWKTAFVITAALLAGCAGPAATVAPLTPSPPPLTQAAPGSTAPVSCDSPTFEAAARANAIGLKTSPWMFSAGTGEKPEGPGWETYVPAIQRTLGTACGAGTGVFAGLLSAWQAQNNLPGDGIMSRETAETIKTVWQLRRAHVARSCLELQKADAVAVPADLVWDGSDRRLAAQTLAAFQRMIAAAKAERPDLFGERGLFLLASAWRDPADDRASCTANPGPCNGTAKAVGCSAHWSGRAIDLNLGFLPGSDPTDSTYANRLRQSQGAAYAWMLDNAGRFGFVNYYYEPWHWEWQGDRGIN